MARTPSTMAPLGSPAPDFHLKDTAGKTVSRDDFAGQPALLLMFICNHCPFVRHVRHEIARLAREAEARGVAVVGINSNDVERYPEDDLPSMAREAAEVGYTFPYLLDETQQVAKACRAACTPDFYLYDRDRRLYYRGQLDESRPGNGVPVTGRDLRAAIDALLAGAPPPEEQKASLGCNIKWRPGNEPDYYRY